MGKIEFMRQFDGENIVEAIYKSGASRRVGLGGSYYRFSETQAEFLNNAKGFYIDGTTIWVDKNTDKRVRKFIARKLREKRQEAKQIVLPKCCDEDIPF